MYSTYTSINLSYLKLLLFVMSVTTTQCHPILKLKKPLEKVPEETSQSNKSDVVNDVSVSVKELAATLKKLEKEKEYVYKTR